MVAVNSTPHAHELVSTRKRDRLLTFIREQGVHNAAVLAQIRKVPRHLFIDEALFNRAYDNTALPIGGQQTISQPYIVARMTELLLQEGPLQNVLEIGTGSGYQTAVLAPLVRRVYTVERIESLLGQARQRFRMLGINNIRTQYSDGGLGWPSYAPFDGIIVTAAPAGIPLKLVEQLRVGGRMVLPVGDGEAQALVLVVRTEDGHRKEILERVSFVPLLDGVL